MKEGLRDPDPDGLPYMGLPGHFGRGTPKRFVTPGMVCQTQNEPQTEHSTLSWVVTPTMGANPACYDVPRPTMGLSYQIEPHYESGTTPEFVTLTMGMTTHNHRSDPYLS